VIERMTGAVPVGGHCFGGRQQFSLHTASLRLQHRGEGGLLFRLGLSHSRGQRK
jgi:hypothetical protein